MKARLFAAIVAAVVLVPTTASAICVSEPFDRVVRQSDSVLVGTIVEASSLSHRENGVWVGGSGVVVRIDVEQVLKGSAEDGQLFRWAPCVPVIAGPGAKTFADDLVGTRNIFLITRETPNGATAYGDITTPQGMTLDEKIARAREALGTTATPLPLTRGGLPWWVWAAALVVILAALAAGALLWRRARRAS